MPACTRSARSRAFTLERATDGRRGGARAQRAAARRRSRAVGRRSAGRVPRALRRARRRPTATASGTAMSSARSSAATRGTCRARWTSTRWRRRRGSSKGATISRRFRPPAATCARPSARFSIASRVESGRSQRSRQSAIADRTRSRGTGFLRHMVRAIVGTLVEVGRGRRPAGVDGATCSRRAIGRQAGPTAPAATACFSSASSTCALADGLSCTIKVYSRRNRNVA